MSHHATTLSIRTPGRGLVEFTEDLRRWVKATGVHTGLVTAYIRHTSAGLLIQENADPEVRRDLERYLARAVPDGDPLFEHTAEGPDDMPAHVRAMLTATTLSIPVVHGAPAFGTWQGIYVYEHRHRPHQREVVVHLSGE